MPTESTVTAAAATASSVEVHLAREQESYIKKFEDFILPEEKKILERGTLTHKERAFLEKKMSIEKKLMSGAYESLYDMATDINDGKPSKEIESVIFKSRMKIMLHKFNV